MYASLGCFDEVLLAAQCLCELLEGRRHVEPQVLQVLTSTMDGADKG
jgi:hypothetical protein